MRDSVWMETRYGMDHVIIGEKRSMHSSINSLCNRSSGYLEDQRS
jgi:hypothetical protein